MKIYQMENYFPGQFLLTLFYTLYHCDGSEFCLLLEKTIK